MQFSQIGFIGNWKIITLALLAALGLFGTTATPAKSHCTNTANAQDEKLKRFEVSKRVMGVEFGLIVYAKNLDQARKAIVAVFERLADLEECMSDYDPDSELSKLCKSAIPGHPFKVSDDLFEVLKISDSIYRTSNGSFDPTVGTLSKIWRKARATQTVPTKDVIQSAMKKVGWQHVKLDAKNHTVTFDKDQIQLDLGGIAKGFAADEAIRIFREQGLSICLIDASGDVTVGDPPPGKKGWSIAISAEKGKRISLANGSVASSGDRYQHLEKDGKRFSHIIHPKTGWGMTDRRFVSVVTSNVKRPGTLADALASAFSVMPLEDIKNQVKKFECDGIRIDHVSKSDQTTVLATGPLATGVKSPNE